MDRFVRMVEGTAGLLLLTVALTTFATVVLRKLFNYSPPDWFDLAQLLLGISIFWGIASACYRNRHILVDLVWEFLSSRGRRILDITATSILLVVSYARLFTGWRFALRRIGLAQLVYLVLFSYTFFWQGFTGLAITIGAILTLFVLMQITARVDWGKALARPDGPAQPSA